MTRHYLTRDLYKGSWKDVLAKYESLTAENSKTLIKPRFVAEGSAIKNLDKIAEVLHNVKPINTMSNVTSNHVTKHYPVFEIIEVRTIRRACPTSEDVIKWRESATSEALDLHTVAASYRIVEVVTRNSEPLNLNVEMTIPPRDPPVPLPMEESTLPIIQEVHTTTLPKEIITNVNVTSPIIPRRRTTPRKVASVEDDLPTLKTRTRSRRKATPT